MLRSQGTYCPDFFEPTYNPTTTSLDRPLARFKIQPAHKAIASLISTHPSSLINLLAVAQEYGVRPLVLHDNFKLNASVLTLSRRFVNCLDNTRIYIEYPLTIDETKKNYIYYTDQKDNECIVYDVLYFKSDNFVRITKLPEIKKGRYDLSSKFKETIEKLKCLE